MMRQRSTLYDTLGVGQDASEKEIRKAFRELTLKYHPDRFSGADRKRAEERFQTITEAFNVLSRPDLKEKYDRELYQGGTAQIMDPKEIARRLAAKGAQALRSGRLAEALENLSEAINHDQDSSRAQYFLGMTLMRCAGRERDAMRHLDRAAQLEPNNAAILAEAAMSFLINGMASRASRLATQALTLDPTNSKATEVLQKLDSPEKTQGDGLLGMLRRKG
jgi:DnaJ-class molecular chaperone